MGGKIKIEPREYQDEPAKEVDSFWRRDKFLYHQRADEVLLVNTEGLVCTHPVGFLEDKSVKEIDRTEFVTALNHTLFNMNVFKNSYIL